MSHAFVFLFTFALFLFQSAWKERDWFGAAPDLLFALVIALSLLVRSRALLTALIPAVVLRVAFSSEDSHALLAFLLLTAFALQEIRRTFFLQRPEMQFALAFLLANAYFILDSFAAGGASPWWGGMASGLLTALAVPALFGGIRLSRMFRPLLEP